MKTKIIYLSIVLFALLSVQVSAQKVVTDSIKVSGNCIMCKKRIETALEIPGVKTANWNVKSKMLHVVYNSEKISKQKICDLVAAAGHDTEKAETKDEVYAKLPFCCLYRDHDHSGIKDEPEGHDHH